MEIQYRDKLLPNQAQALVQELLVHAFGPEELGEPAALIAELQNADMFTFSAWDGVKPLGASISWQATHEVVLFSWLAVSPATRGHGVGTKLIRDTIDYWESRPEIKLILGEIEDPNRHVGSAAHGDPKRRWALYQRIGAKYLDFPFEMPRLSPQVPVGEDMWLISFGGSAHPAINPETGNLQGLGLGRPLRDFLRAYVENSGESRGATGKYRAPIERMLAAAASLD